MSDSSTDPTLDEPFPTNDFALQINGEEIPHHEIPSNLVREIQRYAEKRDRDHHITEAYNKVCDAEKHFGVPSIRYVNPLDRQPKKDPLKYPPAMCDEITQHNNKRALVTATRPAHGNCFHCYRVGIIGQICSRCSHLNGNPTDKCYKRMMLQLPGVGWRNHWKASIDPYVLSMIMDAPSPERFGPSVIPDYRGNNKHSDDDYYWYLNDTTVNDDHHLAGVIFSNWMREAHPTNMPPCESQSLISEGLETPPRPARQWIHPIEDRIVRRCPHPL